MHAHIWLKITSVASRAFCEIFTNSMSLKVFRKLPLPPIVVSGLNIVVKKFRGGANFVNLDLLYKFLAIHLCLLVQLVKTCRY